MKSVLRPGAAILVAFAALQVVWPAPAGVVVQGLVVGSLTALIAFGIALIYGSNRVINFAQADMGAVPAALVVVLVTGRNWPFVPALIVGILAAVAAGAIIERLVIRPFANAPRLILMVATIGLAQILAGAGTALPFLLGTPGFGERLPSPIDISFTIDPIVFGGMEVLVLLTVPAIIAALAYFLRSTSWGIAIRASAESSDRASLLGINVVRTQTIVWVAAAVMAALAMVLRAGVLGLPVGSAFGPQILLRALAAAVIGGMSNYTRMFVAASAFGVVETAIIWNEDSAVLIDPALFVIVVGFLLLQRPDRESRVADQALSSWQATARIRPVPRELVNVASVRLARAAVAVAIAAVVFAVPFVLDDARVHLASALMIFGIIALSLVVLTGWAGEISLGQMGLVAVGAATGAVINVHLGWDLTITVLVSGLVGAAAAVVIGLPALRIRGLFLGVTTLAFALATSGYLLNRDQIPILPDNVTERVQRLPLFARTDVTSETAFYFVCVAGLGAVLWAVYNLQRTRTRRVLMAARDNERATQAFGIDITRTRLAAFALSGFFAAFGGGLFAIQQQALGREVFEPAESLRALTMVVIGGLGSISGALLGAAFLKSTEWFNTMVSPQYRMLFSFAGTGVGLLIVLRFLPGGLARPLYDLRDRGLVIIARRRGITVPSLGETAAERPPLGERLVAWAARVRASVDRRVRGLRRPRRTAAPDRAPDPTAPVLAARGLDVHYGAVQVLFGVNVELPAGEIVALLGTNGAGKSTLLRAISGLTPPSAGTVEFEGVDITGRPPHEAFLDGIVQVPGGKGVFPSLTVAEHLELATWTIRRDGPSARAAVERVYDTFPDLSARASSPAAELSGGQQQMLTLGMAFVVRPKLLMIDELSLGLAPTIVEQLLDLVRAINADGTTVVLVEQSVNVALAVAETAFFMEKGEIRFSGPTAELLERPDILRAVYLHGASAVRSDTPAAPSDDGQAAVSVGRLAVPTETSPPAGPVLETVGLTKRFAGRTAVDDVSMTLAAGEILGIIGPNGAGKTTLFDLLSGFLVPDAGQIMVRGEPITSRRAHHRPAVGLARSFQDARLFSDLTVAETIRVALDRTLAVKDPIAACIGLADVFDAEYQLGLDADELIERFGLGAFHDKFVAELSTGSRRIVDLACQLALGCPVLLLDEPSSGIAQREAEALGPLLRDLRDELGAAMIVIEHDMPLLGSIADRFLALDLGRVVCDGAPDDVLAHPSVVQSYLGSSPEVIERSGHHGARGPRPVRNGTDHEEPEPVGGVRA